MLEDRFAQHDKIFVDKYVEVTSAYTMSVRDYVVRASTSGGAFTLTLPKVSEAKGRFYSIVKRSGGATALTIAHAGDSESWSNISLASDGANAVLYSDGMMWHRLA